jgi:hypothetical protein
MIPDVTNPPELTWRCNCYDGWTGLHCNETAIAVGVATATVSNGWIGAAVGALILLLSKYPYISTNCYVWFFRNT